jgi:enoyl-CoA hydratase/carnithine racemase
LERADQVSRDLGDLLGALEWGLVIRLAAADDVDDLALDIARRLSNGPTFAYGRLRAPSSPRSRRHW